MKKFMFVFVAILALSLMAAPAFALSVKSVVNNFVAGSASTDKEEATVMVYNATGAALENGDVLTYYVDGTDDGRSVTKVNRLGMPVAGVANEAIAASSWGKMLVYGYHSAVKVVGTVATGGAVTAGYPIYAYGQTDDAVTANTANTNNGYAGNGATCAYGNATTRPIRPFGMALDSSAAATTVEAFINCL